MNINYPIYCINLQHRNDRKLHSLNEFKKINIPLNKVTYLEFKKDKRGGIYGCYDSHMKVWDHFFFNSKKKYCLVVEDDFLFPENSIYSMNMLNTAYEFISNHNNDVDILFLHNIFIKFNNKINNNLFSNGIGSCNHAYFINRNYIQNIIAKYGILPEPNGLTITLTRINPSSELFTTKLFYTNNKFVIDNESRSDNYINVIDKLLNSYINRMVITKIFFNYCNLLLKYNIIGINKLRKIIIFIRIYIC